MEFCTQSLHGLWGLNFWVIPNVTEIHGFLGWESSEVAIALYWTQHIGIQRLRKVKHGWLERWGVITARAVVETPIHVYFHVVSIFQAIQSSKMPYTKTRLPMAFSLCEHTRCSSRCAGFEPDHISQHLGWPPSNCVGRMTRTASKCSV